MKRIFYFSLALIFLVSLLPCLESNVSAYSTSGNFGTLEWVFDENTDTLTISGEGYMEDVCELYIYGVPMGDGEQTWYRDRNFCSYNSYWLCNITRTIN